MKFKFALLLLFAIFLAPVKFASVLSLCPSLLPTSNPVPAVSGTFDKNSAELLLATFRRIYPDIEFQGSWDSATVNAQALRFDDLKIVVVYGGLIRQEGMTLDSLALMICHEVGHHYGGEPFFVDSEGNPSWASGEGAADYYSVKSCFAKVVAAIPEPVGFPAHKEDQNMIRQLCQTGSPLPLSGCVRSILAGRMTAKLQWSLAPEDYSAPRVDGFESWRPQTTLLEYSSPQCRLDTFIASALGAERPSCWYLP